MKYILDENITSMIRRVYEEQRNDYIKGDFTYQVKEDLKDLEINIEDEDIKKYTKASWNKLINETTEKIALRRLLEKNKNKTKTKHLKYENLEMRRYLSDNKKAKISKIILVLEQKR